MGHDESPIETEPEPFSLMLTVAFLGSHSACSPSRVASLLWSASNSLANFQLAYTTAKIPRCSVTRHDTGFCEIVEMPVLLVPVLRFTLGSKMSCHDGGNKSTVAGSAGIRVRGQGKWRTICVDCTKCQIGWKAVSTHQSWFPYIIDASSSNWSTVMGRPKGCRAVRNFPIASLTGPDGCGPRKESLSSAGNASAVLSSART